MNKQATIRAASAGIAVTFALIGWAVALGLSSLDLDDLFAFGQFWPEDGELLIYIVGLVAGAAGWLLSYPILKHKVFADQPNDPAKKLD